MPLIDRDMLLFTVIHTGTRSVSAYYQEQGFKILAQHAVKAGWRQLNKYPKQITTIRNPYNVAASWMNNKDFNRFDVNDWEAQWTMWHKAVTTFHFDEIIIMENFKFPVFGKNPNPKKVEVPMDKVGFALAVIEDTGIPHPNYEEVT